MAPVFYEITNLSFHRQLFRIRFIIREIKTSLCKAVPKWKNFGMNPEPASLRQCIFGDKALHTQELEMQEKGWQLPSQRVGCSRSSHCDRPGR